MLASDDVVGSIVDDELSLLNSDFDAELSLVLSTSRRSFSLCFRPFWCGTGVLFDRGNPELNEERIAEICFESPRIGR